MRENTYSVFAEYAPDSSRIFVGDAENRKLAALGASYGRELITAGGVSWRYLVEVRPVTFWQDPVQTVTANGVVTDRNDPLLSRCTSSSTATAGPPPVTTVTACGTQWTPAFAVAPLGNQVNFRVHHPLQVFGMINGGMIFFPQSEPIRNASRVNFTAEFGAGVEYFVRQKRSVSVEYHFHHTSNANTAARNPGTDMSMLKVTCSFGR